MKQVRIILLSPLELQNQTASILSLWVRSVPPPFHLKVDLWRQILALPVCQQDTLHCLAALCESKARLLGLALARFGETPTLDAILVDPNERRCGLGTALLGQVLKLMPEPRPLRFGGGAYHLVPGLPQGWDEAQAIFTTWGFQPDWSAHDLLWEESASKLSPWALDPAQIRLLTPSQFPDLRSLMEHFGRRWQRDTEWRSDGTKLGAHEEVMGAFQEGQLIGFCHLWSPRSERFGPSTFWLDRSDRAWGGIGPVGVHPDCRGTGAGSKLVRAAIQHLRHRGAERIGVDWTAVPEFYEKNGFRPWQCYRGWIRQGGGLQSRVNRTE